MIHLAGVGPLQSLQAVGRSSQVAWVEEVDTVASKLKEAKKQKTPGLL